MGLFSRKKDLEPDGLRGTAVVQSRKYAGGGGVDYERNLNARSAPHTIDLEVHVDGVEPYRVEDTFKVPRALWNIARGVEVPVRVDPLRLERIMIDWDMFEAAGGVEIVDAVGDQYRRDAVREIVSNDPVQRAAAVATVEEYLGEVKAGRMARDDFVGYVDEYLAEGLLSAEERSTAIDRAGEPNS
jgi:hypothetical protein